MFVKIRDFIKFKGYLVEFLQSRRSSEKQKHQKIARKWTFLSLAFCNAPSLHNVHFLVYAPLIDLWGVRLLPWRFGEYLGKSGEASGEPPGLL